MKVALVALAALVCFGCASCTASVPAPAEASQSSPVAVAPAVATPSPGSGHKEPSPSPWPSPSPSPIGTAVAPQVLKPATVLPAVALCSAPVYATADGNNLPLFCRDGALNVTAWRLYTQIGPHVLAAGKHPTIDQLQTAVNADFGLHATAVEISYSYQLAAAYYSWTFPPSTPCQLIYRTPNC